MLMQAGRAGSGGRAYSVNVARVGSSVALVRGRGGRACSLSLAHAGDRVYERAITYQDNITCAPDKRGGKVCIRGLRITVDAVRDDLAAEMSEDQILADFPNLRRDDLKVCVAFTADRERPLCGAGG